MRPTDRGRRLLASQRAARKAVRDIPVASRLNGGMNVSTTRNDASPGRPQTASRVVVERPVSQTVPLIFTSPHSGRHYAPEFLAASRLDAFSLRRSEDSFVESLFAAAPGFGAPLVHATFPRAWCDANREKWELDPSMFADSLPSWVNTNSVRVAAGLGTVARVVASGEAIYRGKLRFADAEQRIEEAWQPFHDTIAALIDGTKAVFGTCLLVDCHSMPSQVPSNTRGERMADIVLGDVHGTSCAPHIVRFVERRLTDLGYRVRRNDPYAGGYITRHYGAPRANVHALQIEIARDLYMDERRIEPGPAFAEVQRDMSSLIEALAAEGARLSQG
jgi:N-formylglutamate amidohydrolase